MARLKTKKICKTEFIGFKCSKADREEIRLKSFVYTEGNMSEFILYAAKNFEPSYEDLEMDSIEVIVKKSAKKKGPQ